MEHGDDGESDRSAADDDGDVLLVDLRPAHGVMADGHRLGEHADRGGETVGERERE